MEASDRFDFEFKGQSRSELLEQASGILSSLHSDLGDGPQAPSADKGLKAAVEASQRLLVDLGAEIAEFSTFPEIVPLKAEHFKAHGMKPPARFTDLSVNHRFYWMRLPMTLRPLENRPFVKLQCGVEFNPGVDDGHLRPVAQMILPDRRFQQLLQANTRLSLGIGEDFEFKVSGAAGADVAAIDAAAKVKGGVSAKAAASAGLVAGPFNYTLKKARIDHSGTGTEKVFWKFDGGEFFEEEEPVLVVVLRVPNEVKEVRVAAALQATHEFRFLAATIGSALAFMGERISSFFKAGAPATHTQVWDLTPRL